MRKHMYRLFPLFSMLGLFFVLVSGCENENENEDESVNQTNGKTTARFNPELTYGTMTDLNGNIYKTVTIGTQTWMAENLRTTKYYDDTPIPNVTDDIEWSNLTSGAYCSNNNTTIVEKIATYGMLYNWYAVNSGKLAPMGWHIPTDAEWKTLTDYLEGISIAGGKLKETGTTHWYSPNTDATNENGFTALPGHCRNERGSFFDFGHYGYWWSNTEYGAGTALLRNMVYDDNNVGKYYCLKKYGCSVRCVMD